MSDPVLFKVTLDLTAQSEELLTTFAIDHLRARGFAVTVPNQHWEKTKDFLRRLKISSSHFRRCIDHPHRPDVLAFPSVDRVQEILSNAEFDAFVKRNKKPTKS